MTNEKLVCQMDRSCEESVTHMDSSGWVYCTEHGVARRSWKSVAKLQKWQLDRIGRGIPLRGLRLNKRATEALDAREMSK